MQMMLNLREINSDSNVVGWYQTGYFGSFSTETLIESQFTYQTNIPNSVVIIYGFHSFLIIFQSYHYLIPGDSKILLSLFLQLFWSIRPPKSQARSQASQGFPFDPRFPWFF